MELLGYCWVKVYICSSLQSHLKFSLWNTQSFYRTGHHYDMGNFVIHIKTSYQITDCILHILADQYYLPAKICSYDSAWLLVVFFPSKLTNANFKCILCSNKNIGAGGYTSLQEVRQIWFSRGKTFVLQECKIQVNHFIAENYHSQTFIVKV